MALEATALSEKVFAGDYLIRCNIDLAFFELLGRKAAAEDTSFLLLFTETISMWIVVWRVTEDL